MLWFHSCRHSGCNFDWTDNKQIDFGPCPNCGLSAHTATYRVPTNCHKPCQAPADGSPCDESAQADKRYCTYHLGQIDKLAQAGRLP